MSKINCCVFGCHSTPKNTQHLVEKPHFYSFSKKSEQQERIKIWTRFAKRNSNDGTPWRPTKNTRICSLHFIGNEKNDSPLSPSYNPSIYSTTNNNNNKALSKKKRFHRIVKRREMRQVRAIPHLTISKDRHSQDLIELATEPRFNEIACQTDDTFETFDSLSLFLSTTSNAEATCQVVHHPKSKKMEAKGTQMGSNERSSSFYGYDSVRHDENKLTSLTAVTLNVFSLLLSLLPNSPISKHEMSWENRLLLFLVKLKTGLTFMALATLFDVSDRTAISTFSNILFIICDRTRSWIFWPSREAIEFTLPSSFKKYYPKCRVIIDCTEIKSEMPKSVEAQNNMYSMYKGTYTVKFFIGIAPCGQIIFISQAYGGRTSDTHITTESGILDKLEPNDVVLADKGFPNIKVANNVVFVMPPFSKPGQAQFTENQMNETYNVASVRIHVERAIQRLKIFNVLTNRLTIDLLPNINEIMHVCSILVNLQPPLIKSLNV